jgi:Mg2+-importing ATPase
VGEPWWSVPASTIGSARGLTEAEAAIRRAADGPNRPTPARVVGPWRRLVHGLSSPLVLLLVGAAVVSGLVGEWIDAAMMVAIVGAGAAIGAFQEHRASQAVARLADRVRVEAEVLRDGRWRRVPLVDVVRGDVCRLRAGSLVPADGVVLDAQDLFVGEAALTGETFPTQKAPGISPADAPLVARRNALWLGSSVRSGTGTLLVAATGVGTAFGAIAARLGEDEQETEFDQGLRSFGAMLTRGVLGLVVLVFALHVLRSRPALESLLFAVALAVGIAPELLPAIVLVNLSKGALAMSKAGVIVRRLSAIEDFGSMDVLCTDKTGTLTEGQVHLAAAVDPMGAPSDEVLAWAAANARLQQGMPNPLDAAIDAAAPATTARRLAEVPYDFLRRRLSVWVADPGPRLITKGAAGSVLAVCTLTPEERTACEARVAGWGEEGLRVLGVATRAADALGTPSVADERALTLAGFLLFRDPPKAGAAAAIRALAARGVSLKVISGDQAAVVLHLAREVGLPSDRCVTGGDLAHLPQAALAQVVREQALFAEVDPEQKERIVLALRKAGHVVGYLGDGINDAPALRAAHVGISVDGAVDVARESADFVLLEHDLDVLNRGVLAGRTTFVNTLKYITMTESANLGNMLSMAAASVFLPFLPMVAKQVLLNNFLSDFPAMALATDQVDEEALHRPRRWDLAAVRRDMWLFGLISAIFDGVTFAVLWWWAGGEADHFRTGWFVESLWTELAVAFVLRTDRPFWRSAPSAPLVWSSGLVAAAGVALPASPLGPWLGFAGMDVAMLGLLVPIVGAYVLAVEAGKRWAARRRSVPAPS